MADIDNQPRKDLSRGEAIEKIKELGKEANICIFHTNLENFPHHASPMALQGVCDKGHLYFLSSTSNQKNKDILQDNKVMLSFSDSKRWQYMTIYGRAEIRKDRELIDKYWTDFAKAWFEGKDDPRISVLEVSPEDGHYWETQDGKIVSSLKSIYSAVTGANTDDGGVDGSLNV